MYSDLLKAQLFEITKNDIRLISWSVVVAYDHKWLSIIREIDHIEYYFFMLIPTC